MLRYIKLKKKKKKRNKNNIYMQALSHKNQLFDTWKVFRAAATVALYKGS